MDFLLFDLAVLLVLLLTAAQGFRKGFVLTLCGFLAVFVAFTGAAVLSSALARPVAEAQMDLYRLVNLRWTYEEAEVPGLDFVILARPESGDRTWQMAALGRGRDVAVFQYGGQADLRDHLDALAALLDA